ncbi:MAG: glycosyltransferase family 4 protein [Abditibacteriota bacterium]|nr:glycosyltransferase family 4 protein [Abditibacteriota bacterium]
MSVLIATDFRIMLFEGRYYLKNKHYHITKRYCDAFGPAILFTRVLEAREQPQGSDATPLLKKVVRAKSLAAVLAGKHTADIRSCLEDCSLAICRFPSIPAFRTAAEACRRGIPVLAECMGDAWDASWNHSAAGKLAALYYYFSMKRRVAKAPFALYVTDSFLQSRYPCPGITAAISNVALDGFCDGSALENRLRRINACDPKQPVLITVAAADNRSKGFDTVIRTLPLLKKDGINAKYVVAGPGDTSYLADLARRAGVSDRVEFTGELDPAQVKERLNGADLYIQPSRQEGLPRAVIEAMACGCPCIGTRIGGIPELVQKEYLIRPGSPAELCQKIKLLSRKENMASAAEENLARSRDFDQKILDNKRHVFFESIKACLGKDCL